MSVHLPILLSPFLLNPDRPVHVSRIRSSNRDRRPRIREERPACPRDHDEALCCVRSSQHHRREPPFSTSGTSSESPLTPTHPSFKDETHELAYYRPEFGVEDKSHGTTHLSVIDKYGSAVSLTSTVNLIFGSRLMDAETGIILNDEMVGLTSDSALPLFARFDVV